VPTSHDRIPVTKDPALAEALDRARALASPGIATATLVHYLAIRGAAALLADHQRDAEAIERLVRRTTSGDPRYDPDILADIDRLGWGQP
jgi:hypothetical protein